MLRALYAYRGFILGNIKREFQSRYQNSLLGAAWNVINPLAMILIYTVIFSGVMRAKLPGANTTFAYSVYLCAGVLTWGLFTEIVSRSQNVFLDNANLLKKINFPRLCLPVTILGSAILNFCIIFGLFVAFLIISGNFPGLVFLALIPILAILIVFAIGLGMTLGVMNVFFRDVGQFFGIFLQFWFWLTPIVYPRNVIPERFQHLLEFNPMAGVVGACQTILVEHRYPSWSSLLPCTILGIVLCFIGMNLFRKHVGEMVDEL
ncbi:ABC transporter permease [Bordetella genomosp. 4]|uniref:ABC transporter permease n=1 Tax=Bordetella genomosp. 4 TaxID=463044 RepID=UPI000B9E2C48|nr:ABC transporter permease [Bordetella genomosp. 4]OZI41830.1 ABC transporter [Bordetella genomosp. 4]